MSIPHGFWPSDWTAEKAAAASRDFAELRTGFGGVVWLEYRPENARCALWHWRAGKTRCLTPEGVSIRSRVYEYGGGAFCLTGNGIAYVNEADQQIWFQDMPSGAAVPEDGVRALTARPDCRYGDLHFAPAWAAVLAVEEQQQGPAVVHRLVAIFLGDGRRQVLAESRDFYAAPRLSPEGRRLVWIEWDRPHQPWSETRLCLAETSQAGRVGRVAVIAGNAGGESLQQPIFAADGQLYCLSDRVGWWQPWREHAGHLHRLDGRSAMPEADHAPAPWQLGTLSCLPVGEGALLLARLQGGFGQLIVRAADGGERRLAEAFTRFRQLADDDAFYYCIAGAPDRLPALLAIGRVSGEVHVLAGGEQPLAEGELSRPEAQAFAVGRGETAHGFLYSPRNTTLLKEQQQVSRPPLIIFLHGGPTSACYPVFDPRIQFWTQRGFAVLDLNYRGSSGYGRAYRQRLKGEWGRVELEDIQAAARQLGADGRIDADKFFVRGASAGGYSALCTLAFGEGFRGGASLYGVSDPLALRRVTHKFEGDYLDWLIGDPEQDAERYRARTPLHHAARIKAPVIFFQGGLDAVVVPAQTEAMVAALKDNGVPVEYHLFPGERHGFRRAENLALALDQECRFYRELLG